MKKLILLLSVFISLGAFAQDKAAIVSKINSIVVHSANAIGQDQFGFSYYLSNNVFHKMKDDKVLEYKNVSLGNITNVDIKNPLKILLYYENFNTAILLDNQLNEVQKINFSENNPALLISAIGMSTQNRLWLYNYLNQQIGLFDYLKNEYRSVSTSLPGKIMAYQANYNSFEWIDENNNWYSCDLFGKITTKGKVPYFDEVVITDNDQIIYLKEQLLYHFDRIKSKITPIKISEKSFRNFDYKDQILSIFTSEGIINYKITIP
ncbi:MAG: hypothetical protein K2Y30_00680 [Flavobacteriaceae bacterium]|nr:hypothetical protein [Flavobacteriaceae bacterium]